MCFATCFALQVEHRTTSQFFWPLSLQALLSLPGSPCDDTPLLHSSMTAADINNVSWQQDPCSLTGQHLRGVVEIPECTTLQTHAHGEFDAYAAPATCTKTAEQLQTKFLCPKQCSGHRPKSDLFRSKLNAHITPYQHGDWLCRSQNPGSPPRTRFTGSLPRPHPHLPAGRPTGSPARFKVDSPSPPGEPEGLPGLPHP